MQGKVLQNRSSGFYEIKTPGTFIDHANSTPRTVYLVEYFERFLNYIKESGAPMDFFSRHSYDDADSNTVYANYIRNILTVRYIIEEHT